MLRRDVPRFRDLRSFAAFLEGEGQLRRIGAPVSVVHEVTEIHRRVIADQGPALLFERPVRADGTPSTIPLLTNLFGTVERVAWGLGIAPGRLGELGELMAELRAPTPPRGYARRALPPAGTSFYKPIRTLAAAEQHREQFAEMLVHFVERALQQYARLFVDLANRAFERFDGVVQIG